jgi:hypothetical protein
MIDLSQDIHTESVLPVFSLSSELKDGIADVNWKKLNESVHGSCFGKEVWHVSIFINGMSAILRSE